MRVRSALPVVLAATGLVVLVGGHEALAIAEWRGSDGFWRGQPYASAPASLIDHDRSLWLQNLLLVSVAVLGAVATPMVLWRRRGRHAGLVAAAAACGVALLLWLVVVAGGSGRADESCALRLTSENQPGFSDRGWSWREGGLVVVTFGREFRRVTC
jgi:hypothetical protein